MGNCLCRDKDVSKSIQVAQKKLESNNEKIVTKRIEIKAFHNKIVIEEDEDTGVKQNYHKLQDEYINLRERINLEKDELYNMEQDIIAEYDNFKTNANNDHIKIIQQLNTKLNTRLEDIKISLSDLDICLTIKAALLEEKRQEMLKEINETNDIKEQLKNAQVKLNELVDESNKLSFSIKSYLKELLIKFFEYKQEYDDRVDITGNYEEKVTSIENVMHTEIEHILENIQDDDVDELSRVIRDARDAITYCELYKSSKKEEDSLKGTLDFINSSICKILIVKNKLKIVDPELLDLIKKMDEYNSTD